MGAVKTRKDRVDSGGFALVSTLLILTALALLLVGLFTIAKLELRTSKVYGDRYRAELAASAGFEEVRGVLLDAVGRNLEDTYHVVMKAASSASGVGADRVVEETDNLVVGVWDSAGGTWNYEPLFSAVLRADGGPSLESPVWPFEGRERAVQFGEEGNEAGEGVAAKLFPTVYRWQSARPMEEPRDEVMVSDPSDPALSEYSPRVEWLPLEDDVGQLVGRYCYWVEDLEGLINPQYAESAGPRLPERAVYRSGAFSQEEIDVPGLDLEEIAFHTVYDPGNLDAPGELPHRDITDNRDLLLTWETLKQPIFGLDDPESFPGDPETYLGVGIRHYRERPVIPFGKGYADEGSPARNVNDFLVSTSGSPAGVDELADYLRRNLPLFATDRNPAITELGDDYYLTLAANIVDYADEDGDATVVTGASGAARGVDGYPVVSSFYYVFSYAGIERRGEDVFLFIEITPWVELWNMTNQSVSGDVSLNYDVEYTAAIGVVPDFDFNEIPNSDAVITGIDESRWFPPQTVEIEANGFAVLEFGPVRYEINGGPVFIVSPISLEGPETQGGYELRWNGRLVDRSPAGVQRFSPMTIHFRSPTQGGWRWRGTMPGLSYHESGSGLGFRNNIGDPMIAYYLNYRQASVDYDRGSSWYGRNRRDNTARNRSIRDPIPGDVIYSETWPSFWPDGGHNTDEVGAKPRSDAEIPFSIRDRLLQNPGNLPVSEPGKAPFRLSNAGRYFSIAELGNVYDPLLWDPGSRATNVADLWPLWKDLGTQASPTSEYGGGNTLRIGRREHVALDLEGTRAVQLLDLLHAGDPGRLEDSSSVDEWKEKALSETVPMGGRVNLNTASRDVLRALMVGEYVSDANKEPPQLAPPTDGFTIDETGSLRQASRVADAIIASRPFGAVSDVAQARHRGKNGHPAEGAFAFGDLDLYMDDANLAGSYASVPDDFEEGIMWNDAVAEELFARVYNKGALRSRNFRVFVTGQSLSRSGEVTGSVSKVFQVYVNPEQEAAGGSGGRPASLEVRYEREF